MTDSRFRTIELPAEKLKELEKALKNAHNSIAEMRQRLTHHHQSWDAIKDYLRNDCEGDGAKEALAKMERLEDWG